jgi:lipopolysaccharide/colanic/teichoic acid biosynthesis glycosyltransferase
MMENKLSILYVGQTIGVISQLNSYDNIVLIACNNKQEAINALMTSTLPDAILCENLLSDGNSIEWHEQLRRNPAFSKIAFILLSHEFDENLFKEAFQNRIDDFFVVPIPPVETLMERLVFLEQYRQKSRVSQQETSEDVTFKIPVKKRIFDLVVAFSLLWILWPILFLVAIAIRLESPGAFFHKSVRCGRFAKVFYLYTFRTRQPDFDSTVKNKIPISDMNYPALRVSHVGRILKSTGFDKLLQLINVIKGDMSIVGNDPLSLYEAENVGKDPMAAIRFFAPVGIISPWQVFSPRSGSLNEHERIRIDNAYADQFLKGFYSIRYDLALIIRRIISI